MRSPGRLPVTVGLFAVAACASFSVIHGPSAVSIDSSGQTWAAAPATNALSLATLTVGSGGGECLIAGISLSGGGVTGLSLTWDAQPMTERARGPLPGGTGELDLFALPSPAPGNHLLLAAWTGAADAVLGAVSFAGVGPSGCAVGAISGSGTSKGPSVTIGSAAGHITVGVAAAADSFLSSSQTSQWLTALSGSAATLVQTAGAGAKAASLTATLPQPIASGDALLLCASWDNTQSGVSSVSGGSYSWSPVPGGKRRGGVWFAVGSAGAGSQVTVSFNGPSDNCAFHLSEWSGLLTGNLFEDRVLTTGLSGSAVTTGSLTTTNAGDLLFACGAQDMVTASAGPENGFTALPPMVGGADQQEEAWMSIAPPGNYSTGWSLSGGTSEWAGVLAAFRVAPAGPPLRVAGAGATAEGSASVTHQWTLTSSSPWAAVAVDLAPGS